MLGQGWRLQVEVYYQPLSRGCRGVVARTGSTWCIVVSRRLGVAARLAAVTEGMLHILLCSALGCTAARCWIRGRNGMTGWSAERIANIVW